MQADILREKFLDFFRAKKHKIIESDSLVPKDDPTVLFTPAGMNQFKKEFLGMGANLKRAATCQRCLRMDDLDKVGKTTGHHTFFEMLGNFSFGDYFKEEAILFAWEFLTEELKIKPEKLWVSVYQDDQEAYLIWKDKIKVPEEKIVKLGDKENFWPSQAKTKGPNGPCGPCSEIFFDQGKEFGCGRKDCNPSCKCGRFVEVWNLVFTQFNRKEGGILEPLPKKNIDTGMGLERLTAVIEGQKCNFETELFKPIIKEITQQATRHTQYELIYAISDHIRAITFAIYDGVLPSNEARGYVVRKLIRKSILHLRNLGINKAFLYKLVPVVSEIMQRPYPELKKRQENIAEIILSEEKSFINTLNNSKNLFQDKFSHLLKNPQPQEAGRVAFQLYDTYGIPLELTKEWLDKKGISFSQEAFDEALSEQKMRSKLESAMKKEVFDLKVLNLKEKETKFFGYEANKIKAKILKILKDNELVKEIKEGENAGIILDQTVFYAESGGQVGDTGDLIKGKNLFKVIDTKKIGNLIIHLGQVKSGSFKNNDSVIAQVDNKRRLAIARNHTATHLLQAALREILGKHIKQQGSLVTDEYLRFDFSHFKDLTNEELARIEELVNSYILGGWQVKVEHMSFKRAQRENALAFFGEKYSKKVRVVSIGDISKELCGGTHLDCSANIGIFKIIQEKAVASGIRRIEAVTGLFAYKLIQKDEALISDIARELKVPKENIRQELQRRLKLIKELEKKLYNQGLENLKNSLDEYIQKAEKIKETKLITKVFEDLDLNLLRKAVDLIKEKTDNTIIALATIRDNQAYLVLGLTLDLVEKGWDAGNLISEIAKIIGGSGGGRKDFAQAGGNQPQYLKEAFSKLKEIINQRF